MTVLDLAAAIFGSRLFRVAADVSFAVVVDSVGLPGNLGSWINIEIHANGVTRDLIATADGIACALDVDTMASVVTHLILEHGRIYSATVEEDSILLVVIYVVPLHEIINRILAYTDS